MRKSGLIARKATEAKTDLKFLQEWGGVAGLLHLHKICAGLLHLHKICAGLLHLQKQCANIYILGLMAERQPHLWQFANRLCCSLSFCSLTHATRATDSIHAVRAKHIYTWALFWAWAQPTLQGREIRFQECCIYVSKPGIPLIIPSQMEV